MDAETTRTQESDTPAAECVGAPEKLDCRAVLTHHWLVRRRGGERVLEALAALLPDCPVYTLVHDPDGFTPSPAANRESKPADVLVAEQQVWGVAAHPVHTSCLQKIPGAKRHYPKLLPFMPLAARRMHLPPADLAVCSDAAFAKAMTPDPSTRLVCYCHSPARYVWDLAEVYGATLPAALRPFWPRLVRRLREADRRAAQRVDQFVANSRHVAERIKRHYGRESVVVHPPVELPATPHEGLREDFYLCAGQHVHYKRLDLAVEACRKLKRKLLVIGEGPDVERYRGLNDPNIRFVGWLSGAEVQQYYRRARGLLFPGEEDFGIVPVEALAHGCPVICYGVGGATESVEHGVGGVWFERQEIDCVVDAIERSERLEYDPAAMFAQAQRFGYGRFYAEMRAVLREAMGSK